MTRDIVKVKGGVDLNGISTHITRILHIIEPILRKYGQEMVITSGLDGVHKQNSKHYSGCAIDLRIWDLLHKDSCVSAMQVAIGEDYDVVLEGTHIHLEYDPK